MNRALLCTFAFYVVAATVHVDTSKVDAANKPNVVMILLDDLNHFGVTAYGADSMSEITGLFKHSPIDTPSIDALARRGLRCDNAFAYPLCEPTRIALMTGQYNSRNFLQCKSQHASEITFGDTFKREGYATGIFGKWKQSRGTKEIHAKDYIFEFGWDEFCCFDIVGAGQRYINPNLVVNGIVTDYRNRKDIDPETGRRWYGPDICNREALRFIDAKKDEPFFLYYPMLLVHDEHKPTPDTLPHRVFDQFDEAINNKNGHHGDDRTYFLDMHAYMDKLIGKVVAKLDEHGLRQNTIIVVMGDNGTKEPFVHHLPDGTDYPGGKGCNVDNGLHVPLIFSCPKTISHSDGAGFRSYDGLVDVTDIYPTLCEAAGIKIPEPDRIDGISFWPQVLGKSGKPRDSIYTWYNGNNPATDSSKTLRYAFDESFKRYAPHANFPQGRFFDLRTDRLERAGDEEKKVRISYSHYHRTGLDLDKLDAQQQAAYARLGTVIDSHDYVPVKSVKIATVSASHHIGDSFQLECSVSPANATRKNLIWETSDPFVASIDKFGVVTANTPGKVEITVYCWEDAQPQANDSAVTYSRDGIHDTLAIELD